MNWRLDGPLTHRPRNRWGGFPRAPGVRAVAHVAMRKGLPAGAGSPRVAFQGRVEPNRSFAEPGAHNGNIP
jgi:hypothetical protein